jgi:hypothetical protein
MFPNAINTDDVLAAAAWDYTFNANDSLSKAVNIMAASAPLRSPNRGDTLNLDC